MEKIETITLEKILSTLTEWVENRTPIAPELWIDAGLKMNLLKDPLTARIIALESSLSQKRYNLLLEGKSAAYANIAVKADTEYAECEGLKAKISLVDEQIKLAKHRARMGYDDYRSN